MIKIAKILRKSFIKDDPNADVSEAMTRKFKKQVKKEEIMLDYKLHEYQMSKKERQQLKAKLRLKNK